MARSVLKAIDRAEPALRPTKYSLSEPLNRKYIPSGHDGPLDIWMGEGNSSTKVRGDLMMSGPKPSGVEYHFSWDRDPGRFNWAAVEVAPEYAETHEGRKALTGLIDNLVGLCDPVFGSICYYPSANSNLAALVDLRIRLPQPSWVLYLGSPYIALFGEARLLSTPVQEVQKLSSGHFKLLLADSPFAVGAIERERVREHLGADAFVGEGKSIRHYKTGLVPGFDFSAKSIP